MDAYFGVVDFIMLGGLLLVSAVVGIYCAYRDRKSKTTENYYFGNRRMSPIPLGFSMAVSFISAITMMGTPVEVYLFGAVIAWVCVGNYFATAFACAYYVPFVYRLKLTSVYEYLEMRFNRIVRMCCSTVTLFMMVFYMGFSVYIPSLALNAVTPLDLNWSIALTSIVCTFYTTVGGFKAVVWTDVIQAVVMVIGSMALLIKGTILVGGPTEVWDSVIRGGRMNIFKAPLDPTVRSAVWPILIGQSVIQCASTCSNQAMVQRVMSCESVKNARRALVVFLFPSTIIFLLAIANGCVLYAYFEDCDPVQSGKITKADQSIPYMMMRAFRDLPGMAGLFVAAACSGTLSTVSTGINSMSVIILQDYIVMIKSSITARQKFLVSRICGLVIGSLVCLIAFTTGYLGTTTVQVATSTLGAFGGPIFGVFVLGMFIPKANSKGALAGLLLGSAFSIWLAIGAVIYGLRPEKAQKLPISTDGCMAVVDYNGTTEAIESTSYTDYTTASEPGEIRPLIADTFYSISFFYFGFLGTTVTIVIGTIASLITGGNNVSELNPLYFVPLVDNKRFPFGVREFFRCGVKEISSLSKEASSTECSSNKEAAAFLRMEEKDIASI